MSASTGVQNFPQFRTTYNRQKIDLSAEASSGTDRYIHGSSAFPGRALLEGMIDSNSTSALEFTFNLPSPDILSVALGQLTIQLQSHIATEIRASEQRLMAWMRNNLLSTSSNAAVAEEEVDLASLSLDDLVTSLADPDPVNRVAAAQALIKADPATAGASLQHALKSERNPGVSSAFKSAMATLGAQ